MKLFVLACSVCFGDPGSASSRAAAMAVLFLMGVVGTVLAGIVATIFVWVHRARKLRQSSSPRLDPANNFG